MSARLLKVVVQAVFVVEDESGLSEQATQPVTVQGRDWEAYRAPGGTFDQAVVEVAAQIDAPPPFTAT